MKTFFLPIAFLFALIPSVFAAETDEEIVRESMTSYWTALCSKDFAKVTGYILPEDLDGVKKELLPVFLEAAQSPDKVTQKLAADFFGKTPENERADLSPAQSYECLNQFLAANLAQMFELLKTSTITVDRVQIDEDRATAHYQIKIQDTTTTDTESFLKKDGKWWLRVKENPKATAAKMRQGLKLEPEKPREQDPAPEAGTP